ncbi:MAG: T9SS type A sorting domain-containing protein [Rhodothermia bacterium]|nr:T9SS type A sorting domain-containing protein [Rhodothermia bacterium]
MKKHLLFFSVLAFMYAMPISAQTISYADGSGGCYQPTAQTMNLLSSGGSPTRNAYAGVNVNGGYPTRVSWNAALTRWEIRSDLNVVAPYDYENLDFYNSFASYPNPPVLGTGTWVKVDSFCLALTQFNGTGTQNSLPISLVSATATVEAQTATLKWVTASETNNDRFVIEQQTPQGWKPVGEVKGKGTSIDLSEYSFTVPNLAYGAHVFRIAQYDKNGYVSYGRMMQVFVELTDTFALSEAYPNPFNPQTNFTLAVAQTQVVQINIYDLQGRKVATLHNGSLAGQTTHAFTFQAQDLSSGRYFVRVKGENFVANKSLVLVK